MKTAIDIKIASAYFYLTSSLFLFALLPMTFHGIYRTALALFFVSFLLDYVVNKRWRGFTFSMQSVVYLCVIFYYLLTLLFLPVETDHRYFGRILEYSTAMLGFAMAGFAGGFNDKFKVKYFALVGAIAPIAYSLYTIFALVGWEYFITNDFPSFQFYNHQMQININAHMGFNIFCNIEILLTYYLFKDSKNQHGKYYKALLWFCSICAVLQLGLIMINQGRVGLLTSAIVLFYIIMDMLRGNKIAMGIVAALFLAAAVSFIATRPRFETDNLTLNEPRSIVWKIALDNIAEKPLLGYGSSTTYAIMQEDILNTEWPGNINTFLVENIANGVWWGGHPHNQLLQSWLNFGVLGMLVMTAIFILPFFALRIDRFFALFCCMWLCILIQLQTEIILTSVSYIGFGFFLLMILSFQGKRTPIINKNHA